MNIVILLLVASIIGGGLTGFIIAKASGSSSISGSTSEGNVLTGKTSEGVKDAKKFPDKAEGTLKAGGIEGEGNFHLERKGGESQNVYLTSSIVDLSQFEGKKVRVWGETFQGQKAGWLMDVGYVETL